MSWTQTFPDAYLIQAIQPSITGLPEDAIINNWMVQAAPLGAPHTAASFVQSIHQEWYDHVEIKNHTPSNIVTANMLYKVFAMALPPPRFPVEITLPRGAWVATSPLPEEVCVVLSLRGSPDTARRRGRMYIGPLTTSAIGVSGGRTEVLAARRTIYVNRAVAVQNLLLANNGIWRIWSRANANLPLIEEVQVDNAFDTQRRRGPDASVRTIAAMPQP